MSTEGLLAFGVLLRQYRAAAGLSQEELAARAGMTPQAVGLLERGRRRHPHAYTVFKLADVLGLAEEQRACFAAAARRHDARAVTHSADDAPGDGDRPALVGRVHELTLLERHLTEETASEPWPRVLVFAGEPGIGKSRLLQEAVQRAPHYGWRVLVGGCQRRSGQEPYAPLLQALKNYITQLSPAQFQTDLQVCAWLVRLLPELAESPLEPLPSWRVPPEQERRLMFAAVCRFLSNVTGTAGTLLVLDDLHWASPDALDLLATLVQSTAPSRTDVGLEVAADRRAPLRIVLAYRGTEVSPASPLSQLLVDLAREDLIAQHTLDPLTRDEAIQLLGTLLQGATVQGTDLVERTVQRAGGVPFYLVSCARALRGCVMDAGTPDPIPLDVEQSIRQRIAALSPAAQDVLTVAAIVGRRVPRAVLSGVITRPEDELLAALEATCAARLLAEEGLSDYHFVHDVIREVVEADLSSARRTVLHRRVAEALERQVGEPPIDLLAYHYSRSEAHDKAVWYLERAGDRAQASYAHTVAADYYRALVERLDGLGRAGDAPRAREKLSTSLTMLGRYDGALTVLDQARETYRMLNDLEGAGRVTAQMGWIHAEQGTPHEGVASLRAALPTLEARGPSHVLAALYAALAHLYYASGQYSEQLEVAKRAVDLARAIGDDSNYITAEAERGCALSLMGRIDEAVAVLDAVRAQAEALGHDANLPLVLHFLALGYGWRGEFDKLRQHVERGVEIAERVGNLVQIADLRIMHGIEAFYRGDWRQARTDFERALAVTDRIDASRSHGYALFHMGLLSLGEGDWTSAASYCDEGITILERSGDLQGLRSASTFRAWCDLLEGRPEAARTRLTVLRDRPGAEEREVAFLLPFLAWAHLELGEVSTATEVVADALRRARVDRNGVALPEVLLVAALIAIRQRQWVEAARALEEGLVVTRRIPYLYGEARLRYLYGDMHMRKGEEEVARVWLETAEAIFVRLGARKDAERVADALAHLQAPTPHHGEPPAGR